MKKERWMFWLENKKLLEADFNNYLKKNIIRKEATLIEMKGHLGKAKRNLRFARRIIDDFKDYYEWTIVAYYYAVYQAALSLCASKGLKTKRHLATIMILIKFYYPHHLTKEDLKILVDVAFDERDIKEFVELKNYREDAAYSISTSYEKDLVESLGAKAIDFVNKVEMILEKT